MPILKKTVVQDFRNIVLEEIEFSPNLNCISGNNGEGKTNLLDAIYYLSMTKSAFSAPDRCNWRYGTEGFSIGAVCRMENGRDSRFSIKVTGGEKRLVRDDKPITRMSDHIGTLPVVMVSPGDISLVSDSGQERRNLCNAILSQMDREYLAAIQGYNRLLAQRNKMLKDPEPDWDLIQVFDERMAAFADPVFLGRKHLVDDLRPVVQDYYRIISGGSEQVDIAYSSDLSRDALVSLLQRSRERDAALRYTSAGLQRDDLLFTMDGHPIRQAGSQGQQKSFLVALKFAQYEVMKATYGFFPTLLLDDVFDKLDFRRISNLIAMVAGSRFGQIFITDTSRERLSGIVDTVTEDRAYFVAKGGAFTRV